MASSGKCFMHGEGLANLHSKKTALYTTKVSNTISPRRSARLQQIKASLVVEEDEHHHLPSPPLSFSYSSVQSRKRKQLHSSDALEELNPSKRKRAKQNTCSRSEDLKGDPVKCWVATASWPKTLEDGNAEMGKKGSSERDSSTQSSKRRSSSTHQSVRLQRLAENGVKLKSSAALQASSKILCDELLNGDRVPNHFPCYPPDKVGEVLENVHESNEPMLQRDITPWIVPSARNLYLCGDLKDDYLMEEKEAPWSQCATMGDSQPKPDFTFGLQRKVFTEAGLRSLESNASPDRPFMFTHRLCFPFLVCEAKTGHEGMEKADRQNLHSGSLAVRAIFRLFEAAFGKDDIRVKKLDGQVLVFTVSHNNRIVNLYGHYAVADDKAEHGLIFSRYDIDLFSLTMHDGRDRFKAYNFVRNLYDEFAPQHLKRIQDAVACLPAPASQTGLSFAASEIGLEESNPQDDDVFSRPSESASASQKKEMVKLLQQLLEQKKDSQEKEKKWEQQLEQQRKDSQEKEKKWEQQLEQQRKDSTQQLEQQKKIIALLEA